MKRENIHKRLKKKERKEFLKLVFSRFFNMRGNFANFKKFWDLRIFTCRHIDI